MISAIQHRRVVEVSRQFQRSICSWSRLRKQLVKRRQTAVSSTVAYLSLPTGRLAAAGSGDTSIRLILPRFPFVTA